MANERSTLSKDGYARERLGVGECPSDESDTWQVIGEEAWPIHCPPPRSSRPCAILGAVTDDPSLISGMPDALEPFILALVPAATAAIAGWAAPHTPRSNA
ncbi:hypothetical protein [Streptomyces sp. NPDC048825]|uniref:hypothetical protein n=1 Tax=Streptomyces sp. NPDC048825 TaxID=3365592 RepID=UPI00371917B1